MEKPPIRLENAITKLYTAFHEGKLNSFECNACAVGTICDGSSLWANARMNGVNSSWNYKEPTAFKIAKKAGYSLLEIEKIEQIFIKKVPFNKRTDKEIQLKGLCAVVEYLCELDNIPNVMDYTKLFETENNEPKYQLS